MDHPNIIIRWYTKYGFVAERSNTSPGTWYTTIELTNAFSSSITVNKVSQEVSLSWQGQQYIFTVLSQGYINSPALCHNLIYRDLDHIYSQQDTTLTPL